jgi:hypothetical protein
MTKWEYRTITISAFENRNFQANRIKIENLEDILRDYGNDASELASQSFTGDIR